MTANIHALLDIHDHIEQLTRTHTHREPFTQRQGQETWTAYHLTMVPPLIDQLDQADATRKGDVGGSAGYTSRPAASIEAIDTLMFIDDEAARWVRKLGEDDPGDTKACIVRVHALHANTRRHHERGDIERAVKRWWSQARITSGWDSPAWRPDNTCPVCEVRRSLRIKLGDQMAFCVDCRSLWDPAEIGLLADWIRLENAEDADPHADYVSATWRLINADKAGEKVEDLDMSDPYTCLTLHERRFARTWATTTRRSCRSPSRASRATCRGCSRTSRGLRSTPRP